MFFGGRLGPAGPIQMGTAVTANTPKPCCGSGSLGGVGGGLRLFGWDIGENFAILVGFGVVWGVWDLLDLLTGHS